MASASFVLGGASAVPADAATPAGAGAAPAVQRPADAVETYGNMATGSCLDDSQYGLRGYACNGSVFQKWNVHKWADNTRQFRSLATNECLYDDGVTLDTRSCNSSRQQSWSVFVKGDKLTFQSQATGNAWMTAGSGSVRSGATAVSTRPGAEPAAGWRGSGRRLVGPACRPGWDSAEVGDQSGGELIRAGGERRVAAG
ncbi:hypothetical protein Sgleb_67290 [Streptomyces glebosus]|uniref:Ricin B lectin domain-containing protein n=1 Tax=Streptomyces glebosus TaxID=249580 RepID=A0A640T6N5_9ACTN|nr:hypothetical protein Sgleb_67290 [Streptomyces glebosus]GHG87838.1 hypothetical protein GCM10010513_69730 [Streptomyces glebosus]